MQERALSNPTIEVDNEVISIIPGSYTFKDGKGDKIVTPESAGGNAITTVVTENAETKKSMVKFSFKSTIKHQEQIKRWSDAANGVSIRVSELENVKNFTHMHITTESEIPTGADATFEVNFEGDPAK